MMGGSDTTDAGAPDAGEAAKDKPSGDDMDDLMKEMMNAGSNDGG